jgi:predicted metalloprotease with PDZ domain
MSRTGRFLVLVLAAITWCACRGPSSQRVYAAVAESSAIEYTVTLDEPQTQMAGIRMRLPAVAAPHIDVALPTWRPGRYVILDSAHGVRGVRARDGAGAPLPIEKLDKATWRVTTRGAGPVEVEYLVYANELRIRTRHVDDSHAFLSGSSVFMYAPSRRGDPVTVIVDAPDGWRIATGLEPHPRRADAVVAANYDVLADSPLEIGRHDLLAFEEAGTPHEIVIWPTGIDRDDERLVDDFRAIVREQRAIFGELPYDRYVFLVHAGPGLGGGTEHLNSTIMQVARASIEGSIDGSDRYERFLGLVSHEMFHTWNVKQFRPAGIQPYDYGRENYTTLLWLVEGATSYYDDLVLVRSGLIDRSEYRKLLARSINGFRSRPGRREQSLEQSSFDAWIKFNHATPDDVNSEVSFYRKGALVSVLLDLELRQRTDGRVSLDDVMRRMYFDHRGDADGYTTDDLRTAIETLAGSSFESFFDGFVAGTDPLPLEATLATVGLELRRERDDADDGHGDAAPAAPTERAHLGLTLADRDGRTVVRAVHADCPAFAAGGIADDEVVAMNGRRLRAADLDDRLDRIEPGETVSLHIMRRDALRVIEMTATGRHRGDWIIEEMDEMSDAQAAALEAWLGASGSE